MKEARRLFTLDIVVKIYLLGFPTNAQLGNYSAKSALCSCTILKFIMFPQQEIVMVGHKLFFNVSVVIDIRRIMHILRIIELELTTRAALAVYFRRG